MAWGLAAKPPPADELQTQGPCVSEPRVAMDSSAECRRSESRGSTPWGSFSVRACSQLPCTWDRHAPDSGHFSPEPWILTCSCLPS